MVFKDQELVYESYPLFQDGSLDLHTGSATSYL